MLCEIPTPRAPANDVPATWKGVSGSGAMGRAESHCTRPQTARIRNGRNTAAPNQPEAGPTTLVPRRFNHVAPQISARAISQASVPLRFGRKYFRYWRNRTGYSAMSMSEYIHESQPLQNPQAGPKARFTHT